jgi:hypothetical protein
MKELPPTTQLWSASEGGDEDEFAPLSLFMSRSDRGTLHGIGPLIEVEWSVPMEYPRYMDRVPGPVHGYLLVDTGASHTGISTDVADELRLEPEDTMPMGGVGGEEDRPIFRAILKLPLSPHEGTPREILWEHPFLSFKEMRQSFRHWPATDNSGRVVRHVGILGRDILQFCRMEYDGPNGVVRIALEVGMWTRHMRGRL